MKWDYLVRSWGRKTDLELNILLDAAGQDGWELVSMAVSFESAVFKRERLSGRGRITDLKREIT